MTQKRLFVRNQCVTPVRGNEHFVNLLRAEQLDVMPVYLAERVWPRAGAPVSQLPEAFSPNILQLALDKLLPSGVYLSY